MRPGDEVAVGIEDGEFTACVVGGDKDFGVIAGAGHCAEAALKKRGRGGSQIRQVVCDRIPQSEKRLCRGRLAQAHEDFAAGHRQQFLGAIENGVGNRGKCRDRIARFDLQGRRVNGCHLFRLGADPESRAIER